MAGLPNKIQWHPGFYGAAELELKENQKELVFEREYNLSKEPLRVDLLIVKKRSDVVISNEIGRIFKRFNVLEYKSPEDELSIDDYYKVVGYACLYKSFGETVNAVPTDELTISLVRESYPREMMTELKRHGAVINRRFPGIYYVTGNVLFATQIIVTKQLSMEEHSSLRVLSKHAHAEDIRRFLTKSSELETPGDWNNMNAVLQVSIQANSHIYKKIGRNMQMYEAIRELMQDMIQEEIDEKVAEKVAESRQDVLLTSIRNLMSSMACTAEQAMNALGIPADEQALYAAKLGK